LRLPQNSLKGNPALRCQFQTHCLLKKCRAPRSLAPAVASPLHMVYERGTDSTLPWEKDMARLQPVRGTHDLKPDDYHVFRHIESVAAGTAALFGYEGYATPIFEFSNVFQKTLGETSDVVTNET